VKIEMDEELFIATTNKNDIFSTLLNMEDIFTWARNFLLCLTVDYLTHLRQKKLFKMKQSRVF
jgi:hypothetical protein